MHCTTKNGALKVARAGTALLLRASGYISAAECLEGLEFLRRRIEDAPTDGILIDTRGAVIALDQEGYFDLLRSAICDPLPMRVGFVVSSALMPFADAHVLLMGKRGFPRKFFVEFWPAAEWVGWQPETPRLLQQAARSGSETA